MTKLVLFKILTLNEMTEKEFEELDCSGFVQIHLVANDGFLYVFGEKEEGGQE